MNLTPDGEMWIDDSGCSWDSKMSYVSIELLGSCGCGNPEANVDYVEKMILHHVADWSTSPGRSSQTTQEEYNDPAVQFFLYWADDKGLSEHGSSIFGSWLTDKGRQLLTDIAEAKAEASQ